MFKNAHCFSLALTEAQVKKELAEKEENRLAAGGISFHEVSASGFIVLGLELENTQYVASTTWAIHLPNTIALGAVFDGWLMIQRPAPLPRLKEILQCNAIFFALDYGPGNSSRQSTCLACSNIEPPPRRHLRRPIPHRCLLTTLNTSTYGCHPASQLPITSAFALLIYPISRNNYAQPSAVTRWTIFTIFLKSRAGWLCLKTRIFEAIGMERAREQLLIMYTLGHGQQL